MDKSNSIIEMTIKNAAKIPGTFLSCNQNIGLSVIRAMKIASKNGINNCAAAWRE